uniref:Choline transporter-like protein n=1 Tax=Odontella aurita TaxID=265563 RepID=A0A7S4J5U8_9STRA|mmetsp:Transcript_39461/g.118470  ORF Transcript_39461/g.118470 Transcript_39461/m.118470 type:complete len:698 (+) Transcript_39461:289-2382(+)|eukprot:CAMPEP_0113549330 /NCGR_PEP_ID=MMETSP0015_2-20120614/13375_1 /TAXON_ID=2838 /ORGANISM="Odontella" /LENGTH=697 /DNA_ID=CAMNT_0000450031 /DNA_START=220 /DNA_END=2313 /DNA_ORIENTATION=- /assembly_acc=CAM_ASM_000160
MGQDSEGTEKLQAPPDFSGPVQNRRCTDVLCSLLLVLTWAAMTGLGFYAVSNGDYRVIVYPMDYDGNICGTNYGNIDMEDYPFLYYVNSYSAGVCVKECPSIEDLTDVYTAITYGGIYQVTANATLAPDAIQMADYSYSPDAKSCTEGAGGISTCYPFDNARLSWTAPGFNRGFGYAYYALDTVEVLKRCIPNLDAIEKLKTETQWSVEVQNKTNATGEADWLQIVDEGGSFWGNLFADLWTARYWIFGFGFGVSLAVGFVYAFFLRIPGVLPFMVWGSLLLTIGIFFGVGYSSYNYASTKEAESIDLVVLSSEQSVHALRIAAYVLWGIGVLCLVLLCALRKQIILAMGCIKEASRSISAMPLIILFPVLQAGGFVAFMAVFFYYGVYLASLGEMDTSEYTIDSPFGDEFDTTISVRNFEYNTFVERSAWFLLFNFYWTSQFILAIGKIVVAMSVSKWYFARNKTSVGSTTVIKSICSSIWHHMGTAAFGALLITIVKMIRSILIKLQKKAEQMNRQVAQVLFCCCNCCLWCLEKFLRFLNKNAYIQTAIFGTSFCRSAREGFFLVMRNAGRISAITFVSWGVIFVGKLFITTFTCGIAYFAFDEYLENELHSPIGPIVFIGLIGFFVGGMFMNVFSMGISTILHCFVADEEMFGGTGEMYAEGKLRNWIDDSDEKLATSTQMAGIGIERGFRDER